MQPFLDVFVRDMVEDSISYLVVMADEKLAEASVFFGVCGQIFLIGAVVIGLEAEFFGFDFFGESTQGFHLYPLRKTLRQNGQEDHSETNKLDDERIIFVHGLESEIDEWIEVRDA